MHKRLLLILTSFLLYKKIPPPPHPKFVYNEMLFIFVLLLNIFYSTLHFSFTLTGTVIFFLLFLFLYVSTLFSYPCTSPLFTADRHISIFIENLQFLLGCTLARSHFEWYSTIRRALLENSPTSCRHFPVVPYAGFFIRCGFFPMFADFVYSWTRPMYERYHTVLYCTFRPRFRFRHW
jgi:hypothetical protein